jgi:GntR family transcriptional regulator, vanillate catabolism transcriptional regulator
VRSGPAPQSIRALLGLRELLLDGAFAPGERLSEIPLGERLGVSRTPLRLALTTLEHEGLLETHPSGGFRVRAFTVADAIDAIELRGVLEGTAARLAAERGAPPAGLATIRQHLADIDELIAGAAPSDELFEEYVVLNGRFHGELLALAASPILERSMEHATSLPFATPNAFVRAQAELPTMLRVLTVAQEQHRALVDALENREGGRAEHVAREHARLARRNLEDARERGASLGVLLPGGALIRDDEGRPAV